MNYSLFFVCSELRKNMFGECKIYCTDSQRVPMAKNFKHTSTSNLKHPAQTIKSLIFINQILLSMEYNNNNNNNG